VHVSAGPRCTGWLVKPLCSLQWVVAMSAKGPATNPCGSCPYRQDVPSGVWVPEEYAKLPAYDRSTPEQPPRAFFCHQGTGRLCAGWVGCHDMNHSLALRMACSFGTLTPEDCKAAIDYECPVPLWPSGEAAAEHGMAGIEALDERAVKVIDRLVRKRDRTVRK